MTLSIIIISHRLRPLINAKCQQCFNEDVLYSYLLLGSSGVVVALRSSHQCTACSNFWMKSLRSSLSLSISFDWNRFPVAHHFWLTSSDWAASSHSLHMITHKFHKTISSTRGGRGWWGGGRWGSLSSSSSSRTAAWRARPQPARARRLWLVWLCLASLIHSSSPHSIPITSPPPASLSPQTFKNSSTTDVHYCPMHQNSVSQWFMPPLIRSAVAD